MQITDQAKTQVESLFQENEANNLRVYFAGAGCCGPSVGLALDEPTEEDTVDIINGVRVAIDQRVSEQIQSLTLDFQETEQGKGFVMLGQDSCC